MTTRDAHPAAETAAARPAAGDQVRRARRTGAWAGLLWLVAGVGSFTPETPGAGAGPAEIRAYVEQNLGTLTLNAVSSIVAIIALLALVAALTGLVEAHRPGGVVGRYVMGAGTLAAVQMAFFTAVYGVWRFLDLDALNDAALTTLYTAGALADAFGSLVLFVSCSMVAVVSWLALRHRILSRPVAVFGLLVAAGQLLSVGRILGAEGSFITAMYVGIFGWFLWPAVVAIDLWIRMLRLRDDSNAVL